MGYYHIELSTVTKQLYNIVLPWGKYEYQKLTTGICNSPYIFQNNISQILEGFYKVGVYIGNYS